MQGKQNSETTNATTGNRQEQDTDPAFDSGEAEGSSAFNDVANLFTLIGESFRGTARLLGLETLLVVKTVVIMMVLGVVLGLLMVGVWFSITAIVAAGLYEYTDLGVTLSVAAASLINVACAGALLLLLKRLAQRLAFPQTRTAVSALLDDAARIRDQQVQEQEQKQE